VSDDVTEAAAESAAPKPKRKSTNPKGRTPLKLSTEQIIAALEANAGMISRAARKLGVGNETLRSRIRKSSVLQEARDRIRKDMVDLAEDNLITVLRSPKHKDHYRATEFLLRTLGRDRGYGDQMELNVGKDEKRVMLVLPQKAPLPDEDASPEADEPKG
jgi:transposase-like protein